MKQFTKIYLALRKYNIKPSVAARIAKERCDACSKEEKGE